MSSRPVLTTTPHRSTLGARYGRRVAIYIWEGTSDLSWRRMYRRRREGSDLEGPDPSRSWPRHLNLPSGVAPDCCRLHGCVVRTPKPSRPRTAVPRSTRLAGSGTLASSGTKAMSRTPAPPVVPTPPPKPPAPPDTSMGAPLATNPPGPNRIVTRPPPPPPAAGRDGGTHGTRATPLRLKLAPLERRWHREHPR